MATYPADPASLAERALQRSYPRQEPSALDAHAGICAGGRQQRRSLPRLSHAGSALLAEVADKTGLTRALNVTVGEPGLRAGSHDRGRVIRDLAVMLADGGDCLADCGRSLIRPRCSGRPHRRRPRFG